MDYITAIILSSCYQVILCTAFVCCMCSISMNGMCLCILNHSTVQQDSVAAEFGIHIITASGDIK